MVKKLLSAALLSVVMQASAQDSILIYHEIRKDLSGAILPWYNEEPGKSYNHVIQLVWHFWDTMRTDMNGLPYYMNHQVWKPGMNDPRGLGGDQIQMALSSWRLLYAYTGNERIKENMRFLADYYITNGFSPSHFKWANIPFPYNSLIYSGKYDGDMVIGKDFTQPDKAGSLGIELVNLYKMLSKERYPNATDRLYLQKAMEIANTLAANVSMGDDDRSPLPFKVNARTGEPGKLKDNAGSGKDANFSVYTTNWSGTLELFLELIHMKNGNISSYQKAFDTIINWMKKYPLQNNRWGPFFEDIPGWSDTQINAITFAQFMMNHPQYFPEWKKDVKEIFDWVYEKLGNKTWEKYGVVVVNEQTAYMVPGNSHTSRQASAELQYYALTGDSSRNRNARLQLNWATYMVDKDGKNRYPKDENWLTDGYGDYVRHFIRAMSASPDLAPSDEDHILSSTSVIQQADYPPAINEFLVPEVDIDDVPKVKIYFRTFDKKGVEVIRMKKKPVKIFIDRKEIREGIDSAGNGYAWKALSKGGILTITRNNGNLVLILD